MRELAIRSIVEGSARARLGRALNTNATMTAQSLNLQPGEEVDVYRPPSTKDISGWTGPATVVNVNEASRGVIHVMLDGQLMHVQLANIRRHLYFLCFYLDSPVHRNVVQSLKDWIGRQQKGKLHQLSLHTLADPKHQHMQQILRAISTHFMGLKTPHHVRTGRGLTKLPPTQMKRQSTTLIWNRHQRNPIRIVDQQANHAIHLKNEYPDWEQLITVQIFDSCEIFQEENFDPQDTPRHNPTTTTATETSQTAESGHLTPINPRRK